MSNIPELTLELDKPRVFRMDLRAMMRFEEKAGKPLAAMTAGSFTDQAIYIWAGLVRDDPDLTLEQVGDMIGPGELAQISEFEREVAQGLTGKNG